jgi:hypothetical protein
LTDWKPDNLRRFYRLNIKQLAVFLFVAQGIGAAFYAVFSAAYILAIPSIEVLSGEPVFKWPLTVFGVMFVILILVLLLGSAVYKPEN